MAYYCVVSIYTPNGILHSHKKEWNTAICDNIDRLRGYYANETSQMKKGKYHMTSLMCGI